MDSDTREFLVVQQRAFKMITNWIDRKLDATSDSPVPPPDSRFITAPAKDESLSRILRSKNGA